MTIPAPRSLRDDTSWVLAPLLELPHVIHAAVVSGDGLIEGRSPDPGREAAEPERQILEKVLNGLRTLESS
ncbi:hypothetical protein FM076_14220 [Streptomyces albus subsp. chlorinus]|uniref:hypothetical protein n=1 Tax=Streptomyces albus TaxID=1888 RepID=UPI001D349B53|nr:hypothetical protein [Streptomyces albus subsp. chlorinus]